MTHLFVYGTLRRSGEAHDLLEVRTCFVSCGSVVGTMHDHGAWPSATLGGDGHVYGEVFEMQRNPAITLAALDAYEGPKFRREKVDVTLDNGTVVPAWIWVWADPAGPGKPIVDTGDWNVRCKNAADACPDRS